MAMDEQRKVELAMLLLKSHHAEVRYPLGNKTYIAELHVCGYLDTVHTTPQSLQDRIDHWVLRWWKECAWVTR